MAGKEIEHGAEHRRIGDPGAQGIGGEAGKREEAIRPAFALQQPAERAEGQCLGIGSELVGG